MKKAFLHILIGFAIFQLVMVVIHHFTIKGLKNYDKATYNKFDLSFDDGAKQDIVLLGSSRTYYGINCFLLEKLTKKKVTNLGLEGAKINEMELALKGYLNTHPKPEKIYLMLDPHSFGSDSSIYNKIYFANYLDNDSIYVTLKHNLGYKALLWKWLPYTIITEFDDYTRTKSLKGLFSKYNSDGNSFSYKGFSLLEKQFFATELGLDVYKINLKRGEQSLENIIISCINKNIDIQIIQGPFLEEYYNDNTINVFYNMLGSNLKKKFPTIPFQNKPLNYSSVSYFKDETHLNDFGSTKYTYDLFTTFVENK